MKFIIDDKIPYIKGALEPYGQVVYLPGNKTTADVVKDADALITRTRTICNETLLRGSKVKFIASATIGYDHIDTAYCKTAGIEWVNAPGCNSRSVEQYIVSALFMLAQVKRFSLRGATIGVVGVGQVGSKVARVAQILGMKVLLNDPPRVRAEGREGFTDLNDILREADIISLHVPLNINGEDTTFHMADKRFFSSLGKKPILINSCRGEVVDTRSLKEALKEGTLSGLALDCWENEPVIDRELLSLCSIATPHIAGYSRDGKAMGTSMSVQAVSRFFNLGADNWTPGGIEPPLRPVLHIDTSDKTEDIIIAEAVKHTYDIGSDDRDLRNNPSSFEKLRDDYPVRREYAAYTVHAQNLPPQTATKLTEMGFNIASGKS